jgi:hypothetical protein
MIGKIGPGALPDLKTISSSISLSEMGRGDFSTVFRQGLEGSKPLETFMVEILRRMIEAILSEIDPQENGFPLSSSVPPVFPVESTQTAPITSPIPESPSQEIFSHLPAQSDYESIIEEASLRYRVPSALIKAVIKAESNGNASAVSPAGAQGLMQLMPATASELGVRNAFDPEQNIMAGTSYLRRLLDRYRGDVRLSLAAYNWGMGNLERRPNTMPKETRNYIVKVEGHYRDYLGSAQTT